MRSRPHQSAGAAPALPAQSKTRFWLPPVTARNGFSPPAIIPSAPPAASAPAPLLSQPASPAYYFPASTRRWKSLDTDFSDTGRALDNYIYYGTRSGNGKTVDELLNTLPPELRSNAKERQDEIIKESQRDDLVEAVRSSRGDEVLNKGIGK